LPEAALADAFSDSAVTVALTYVVVGVFSLSNPWAFIAGLAIGTVVGVAQSFLSASGNSNVDTGCNFWLAGLGATSYLDWGGITGTFNGLPNVPLASYVESNATAHLFLGWTSDHTGGRQTGTFRIVLTAMAEMVESNSSNPYTPEQITETQLVLYVNEP
jgi:hypothetical protein